MSLRIGKRNFKGIFNEKKDSWVLLLMEEMEDRIIKKDGRSERKKNISKEDVESNVKRT